VLDTRIGSSGCIGYVVVALGGELDATNGAGTARMLPVFASVEEAVSGCQEPFRPMPSHAG
jgi:hypothetical protein